MKEIKETIRRWYNKIRIRVLEIFTSRVQRFEVTDRDGKKHEVTMEKSEEKLCQHKRLEQIDHITWKCMDCPEAFFFIVQKLIARREEVEQHILDVGRDLQGHA